MELFASECVTGHRSKQLVPLGNKLCMFIMLISTSAHAHTHYIIHSQLQDHWKEPKSYDNRRYYGNEYMRATGQERAASMDGLFSVLSKWPVRNNDTTYTSLMNPKQFKMSSYDVYTVYDVPEKKKKEISSVCAKPSTKQKQKLMYK